MTNCILWVSFTIAKLKVKDKILRWHKIHSMYPEFVVTKEMICKKKVNISPLYDGRPVINYCTSKRVLRNINFKKREHCNGQTNIGYAFENFSDNLNWSLLSGCCSLCMIDWLGQGTIDHWYGFMSIGGSIYHS